MKGCLLTILAVAVLWVGGAMFFNYVWPGTYGDAPVPTESETVIQPAPTFENAPSESSTRSTQNCTPGYEPCLPPAPDYDCYGGSGDGPAYTGRVYVTGSDPYELDRDRNGVGCEWS